MRGLLRSTDYMGMRADEKLYVLLTNTGRTDAVFVEQRFEKKGYQFDYNVAAGQYSNYRNISVFGIYPENRKYTGTVDESSCNAVMSI